MFLEVNDGTTFLSLQVQQPSLRKRHEGVLAGVPVVSNLLTLQALGCMRCCGTLSAHAVLPAVSTRSAMIQQADMAATALTACMKWPSSASVGGGAARGGRSSRRVQQPDAFRHQRAARRAPHRDACRHQAGVAAAHLRHPSSGHYMTSLFCLAWCTVWHSEYCHGLCALREAVPSIATGNFAIMMRMACLALQKVELKAVRVVHVGTCDNSAGNYALAKKKMSMEVTSHMAPLMHDYESPVAQVLPLSGQYTYSL